MAPVRSRISVRSYLQGAIETHTSQCEGYSEDPCYLEHTTSAAVTSLQSIQNEVLRGNTLIHLRFHQFESQVEMYLEPT